MSYDRSDLRETVDGVKHYFVPGIFVIVVSFCIWTSFFFVGKDENSVVQRLGAYSRTVEPGIRFKLPWPIEIATEVPVERVHRLEIGFRTVDAEKGEYEHNPAEDEMITGDENIAHIDMVVQYRPSDARKWLFNAVDPEQALRLLSQSAERMVVAGSTFDDISTTGRAQKQLEIKEMLQKLVNLLEVDLGGTVDNVLIQDVHPPEPVMAAFKDVTNAKENQQQYIRDAEGYRNQQIPRARAAAKKATEDALGYKTERINLAQGEADRFLEVLSRYEQAPDLVRQRMRFEAIEATLTGKSQLIDHSGGNLLKFFDTNRAVAPAAAQK